MWVHAFIHNVYFDSHFCEIEPLTAIYPNMRKVLVGTNLGFPASLKSHILDTLTQRKVPVNQHVTLLNLICIYGEAFYGLTLVLMSRNVNKDVNRDFSKVDQSVTCQSTLDI